ncbi:MAG: hypothetical protein IIA45_14840 [Bacteroidetes bacterium]|nr:hypothetical protein [Bacteroidota bacterium]
MIDIILKKKVLLFLIISFWIILEYIMLGPFSYMEIHDTGDQFIPREISLSSEIINNGTNYWYHLMGSGVDRLANDMVYPHFTTLLFVVFPGWIAYVIIVLTQIFMGGYFTYKLTVEYLKFSDLSGIYAGCVFALFSTNMIYMQMGIAFFPFVLWSLERLESFSPKRKIVLIFALGLFYSYSSSLVWTLPFTSIYLLLWFVLVREKTNYKYVIHLLLFIAVTFSLYTTEIWSLLLNSNSSHRADWGIYADANGPISVKTYMQSFIRGLKFLFVIGYVPVFLIMLSLFIVRFKNSLFTRISILFALSTVGISLINLVRLILIDQISFLRGFHFDRFYEFSAFFGGLSAALSLEIIKDRFKGLLIPIRIGRSNLTWKASNILIFTLFGLLLFSSLKFKMNHLFTWIKHGSYTANYNSEVYKKLSEKQDGTPFRVATIFNIKNFVLHPAFANAYGLETVDGYINLYPERYQRFWAKVIEPFTNNNKFYYYYFNYWGNRVYLFHLFEKENEIVFKDNYRLNLLSLANTKYIISRTPIIEMDLEAIIVPDKPLGTLSMHEKVIERIKENIFGNKQLFVYENKSVLPRFFITNQVKTFNNTEDLLTSMSLASLDSLRQTVYIEKSITLISNINITKHEETSISLEKYSPDKINLTVELDGDGILVVSNNYSTFWKCRINGIESEIFPAYGTFWAVYLEEGKNEVHFYYDPPYKVW